MLLINDIKGMDQRIFEEIFFLILSQNVSIIIIKLVLFLEIKKSYYHNINHVYYLVNRDANHALLLGSYNDH